MPFHSHQPLENTQTKIGIVAPRVVFQNRFRQGSSANRFLKVYLLCNLDTPVLQNVLVCSEQNLYDWQAFFSRCGHLYRRDGAVFCRVCKLSGTFIQCIRKKMVSDLVRVIPESVVKT